MAVARRADDRWSVRPSGLSIIGNIQWGTHICQFYQDRQDLRDALIPFFAAGLRENEYCLWATADSLTVEEAWAALSRALGDLTPYLIRGQLEIIDVSKWFSVDGQLIARHAQALLANKLAEAQRHGFEGLRLAVNTCSADRPSWPEYLADALGRANVVSQLPIIAISTYDQTKCSAADLLVIAAHYPYTLIRRNGNWQIIRNCESKRIKAALQQSEERFRAAFQSTNVGFCLVRATDGTILEANQAWLNMVGYSFAEIIGREITDLGLSLEAGAESPAEITVRRKDGQIGVHSVIRQKVTYHNDQCFLLTVRDLTDLVKARTALGAAAARAQVFLQEKEESRRQMLRLLVEEINDPLTAITGLAQVLEMKTASNHLAALTEKITVEVGKLSEMLAAVLEALRLETGQLPLTFRLVDWAEITEAAIAALRAEELCIEADIQRQVMVRADAERLAEVVRHLLSNAAKYSEPGGCVEVKLEIQDQHAILSVSDKGVGVPANELDRIFESFYCASNVACIGPGGIGLALYLSKHLIEQHHGRIWAESTLGRGTTFFVELPLA